jgi:uncharacterized damage-inducible protein DinB
VERRELEQLFAFDRWANQQTLAALRSLGEVPVELRDLCWHVGTMADNWVSRIDGSEPFESNERGQSPTLEEIDRYQARVDEKVQSFLVALQPERLDEIVEYRYRSGRAFRNVVRDALQQLILHGVEHRAQVMWEIGKLGGEPVELEYSWFLREELSPDSRPSAER